MTTTSPLVLGRADTVHFLVDGKVAATGDHARLLAQVERALADFGADPAAPEVRVVYHSFELSPDTPIDFEGTEVDFLASHKGLPAEQVEAMLAQMTELAATEGLTYDFGFLQHTNTLLAHELLHHAKTHGLQVEVKERLLRAYFTEGASIGDIDVLQRLGEEIGLPADDVRRVLTSDAYAQEVRADEAAAGQIGISGVPFFVLDGKLGVSGAQPVETFERALTQAWNARDTGDVAESDERPTAHDHEGHDHPDHDHADGATCDGGSCAI